MASAELASNLDYLTNAAHLLRSAAPETSAHLMSQRATLLHHHDIPLSDTQRQHVCAACGHIMIPGQGTSITLETRRKALRAKKSTKNGKKEKSAVARSKGPVKVISCGFCDRSTRITLPPPDKITRRKVSKAQSQKKVNTAKTLQAPIMTTATNNASANANANANANASSKKRAKSRKAGLQALISSQQQRQSTSLSLADFMRK